MQAKRKLPQVGQRVAYTRNFLLTIGSKAAAWRGRVDRMCEFATPAWPMAVIVWEHAPDEECNINLHNLCTTKSVAFVEV